MRYRYTSEIDLFTKIEDHDHPQTIIFTQEHCKVLSNMSYDERVTTLLSIVDTCLNVGYPVTRDLCNDYFFIHSALNVALSNYNKDAFPSPSNSSAQSIGTTATSSNASQVMRTYDNALNNYGLINVDRRHMPSSLSTTTSYANTTANSMNVNSAPQLPQSPSMMGLFALHPASSDPKVKINDDLMQIGFKLGKQDSSYDFSFYWTNRNAIVRLLQRYVKLKQDQTKIGHIIDFTHGVIVKNPRPKGIRKDNELAFAYQQKNATYYRNI